MLKKFIISSVALAICVVAGAQQALWGGAQVESPVVNQDGTVTFRYFAPKAVKVTVSGDFLPTRKIQTPFGEFAAKCDAAAETFAAIAASASGEIADRARHESTLAAYMGCCYTTVRHLREGAIATLAGDRAKVWELAKAEYANKRRTLGLVRRDSRLGWEPSMEYTGGAETIKWSMRRMEKVYGISPCL